jgi:riboflavin biosynthesis pyrimidine reductase
MSELLQLFPAPHATLPLRGRYLAAEHRQTCDADRPCVYANFVTSLDGRIALHDNLRDKAYLPDALTNPNDFRLFLELQAQADCLITHGGYLRDLAAGRLGNILQVGIQEAADDLPAWRESQGLPAQPDILIASASLDFPMPQAIDPEQQRVMIATGQNADPEKIHHWQEAGYKVLLCGPDQHVEGRALIDALSARGYRSIYLAAGPQMLETMLLQQQLDRLYLTQSHQFLGGETFHTPIPGKQGGDYGRFRLETLYLDTTRDDPGQWFSCFSLCYD